MEYIVTYFPELRKQAQTELERRGVFIRRHLAANVSLVSGEVKKGAFSETIFVRHAFPLGLTAFLPYDGEDALRFLRESAKEVFYPLNYPQRVNFSVQCRVIGGTGAFSAKDAEVFVGKYFDELGFTPVFSDYELVERGDVFALSILIVENEAFIGCSNVSDNAAFSPDEYRVLSRGGGRQISRAENKLKEALYKFGVKISGRGNAIDVGASPGGWSKVLADGGYTVYAVDPAELSDKLTGNPKIRHYKGKIQDFNFNERFEIIVCDMNAEPLISAQIMNVLADNAEAGARAVVTIKLPYADVWRSIKEATDLLSRRYEVLAIKNLTHNRREVTALLRRK